MKTGLLRRLLGCLTLALCAHFTLLADTPLVQENFDAGSTGWTLSTAGGGNAWKYYTDQGVGGSGGLRCNVVPATNAVAAPLVSFEAGKMYRISVQARAKTANRRRIEFSLNAAPQADGNQSVLYTSAALGTGFTGYSYSFFATQTADLHVLIRGIQISSSYTYLYLDEVVIEELTTPQVDWVQPAPTLRPTAGEWLPLEVGGMVPNSQLSSVSYTVNGQPVATLTAAPFRSSWQAAGAGTHTVSATVMAANGESTTLTRTLAIDARPHGSLLDEAFTTGTEGYRSAGSGGGNAWRWKYNKGTGASGAYWCKRAEPDNFVASYPVELVAGGSYRLRLDGRSNKVNKRSFTFALHTTPARDGQEVDFYTSPGLTQSFVEYDATFTAPSTGTYYLLVKANKISGSYVEAIFDNLRLDFLNAAPTATFAGPAAGSSVAVGSPVALLPQAGDADGWIARMDLAVNGTTVYSGPAVDTVTYTPTAAGSYTVALTAYDAYGAAATAGTSFDAAGTTNPGLPTSLYEDFEDDLVGWTKSFLSGGNSWNRFADQGVNGAGGMRCKRTPTGNHVSSPALFLTAGQSYTVAYRARIAQGPGTRYVNVRLGTQPGADANNPLISRELMPGYAYITPPFEQYTSTFTVSADGVYHIIFEGEGGGYKFLYLDEVYVEPTVPPTVSWLTPPSSLLEGDTLTLAVTAADADGQVARVEFSANGQLLHTATTAPYTFDWSGMAPGQYSLTATAYDNRAHTATATISATVNFTNGTLDEYVQYDLEDDLEQWTINRGWRKFGNGYQGSGSLYGQYLYTDNFVASPGIELYADSSYVLEFRQDGRPGRKLRAEYHTSPGAGGTELLTIDTDSDDDYQLRSVAFTVPADAVYYLVFRDVTGSNGYHKHYLDAIRLIGPHNQVPYTKVTFTPGTPTTFAEGSSVTIPATSEDPDGQIAEVEFLANGSPVDEDTAAPYAGDWANLSTGTYDLVARGTDLEGASGSSRPVSVTVAPDLFTASSYLGGAQADAVRGSVIQSDGTVVLAANLSALPGGATPTYLAGAQAGDAGTLLRLSADGTQLLGVTVVGPEVVDLSRDGQDRLYLAAGLSGALCLSADAGTLVWQQIFAKRAHRIDAGPAGYCAVLTNDKSNYDEVKLGATVIHSLDPGGQPLGTFSGATTYTTDVCIDEVSQTIVSLGYKNVQADTPDGPVYPVDIPAYRGTDYTGSTKYVGYNWTAKNTDSTWLNLAANNMADTRGARCEMGADGQLYLLFETDGGNHPLRYSPFDQTLPVSIVGGDAYSEFYNTGTEPKVFVGRYAAATGQYLTGQQLCARLSNGAGNTIRTKNGNLAADAAGRVYVTGTSASGIPITLEYRAGDYLGGALIAVFSPDMSSRPLLTRLTNGGGRTVAVHPNGTFVFGGHTSNPLFTKNPLQVANAGDVDAWFGVHGGLGTASTSLQALLPTAPTTATAARLPQLSVYPNPAQLYAPVRVATPEARPVEVYDLGGRLLRVLPAGQSEHRLYLPRGAYVLKSWGYETRVLLVE